MKKSTIPPIQRIKDLLKDGKYHTTLQISEHVGIGIKSVRDYMREATRPGPDQWAHIAAVAGGYKMLVFAYGPGENVNRSAANGATDATYEAARDAQSRAADSWWPRADLVVVAAMHAMVGAGRAAA